LRELYKKGEEEECYAEALDEATAIITAAIHEAVTELVPIRKISNGNKRWWSPEIKEAHADLARCTRLWEMSREARAQAGWQAARCNLEYMIRAAKKECWESYLVGLEGNEIFRARHYTRPRAAARIQPLTHNGTTKTTFHDKEETLTACLYPTIDKEPHQYPSNYNAKFHMPDLTLEELRDVVFSNSQKSAGGDDGLNYMFMQKVFDAVSHDLLQLYSMLVRKGHHPSSWKNAKVVILPKPSKPDYSKPKAYRPIALISVLSKVLEKTILKQVTFILEAQNLLHFTQMGARQARSAPDAVFCLMHEVDLAHKRKRKVSTLFADVSNAFGHVSRTKLLCRLQDMGMPMPILKWVKSCLTNRTVSLNFDGQRGDCRGIHAGLPQGSPILPILFLVYIAPLFTFLEQRMRARCPGCRRYLCFSQGSFVDDLRITISTSSICQNVEILRELREDMHSWGAANRVSFNAEKE
jgi:hypothetical protein